VATVSELCDCVRDDVAEAANDASEREAGSAERMTILPPPSEEGARTLTLATIHVGGRGVEVASMNESSRAAEPDSFANSATRGVDSIERAPDAPRDPFVVFVGALVDVALAAGATRAAAILPAFLEGAAQDASGFSEAIVKSMVASNIVSAEGGSITPSTTFTATSSAWRMVLRGESDDFSACGTSTLDGWAADLLKAFGVGRDAPIDVRRELRRRGVAAFGMILAA